MLKAAMLPVALVLGIILVGLSVWNAVNSGNPPPVDAAHVAEWVLRLKTRDAEGRFEARLALARLGEAAVPQLIDVIERDEALARYEAAIALSMMPFVPRAAAVPGLIRMVQESDLDCQRAAVETLQTIGPSAYAAVPWLEKLVRDQNTSPAPPPHSPDTPGLPVKKLAFHYVPGALAEIQSEQAVPFLIEALHISEARADVLEAFRALGAKARAAVPALEGLAREVPEILKPVIHNTLEDIRRDAAKRSTSRRSALQDGEAEPQ